MDATLVSQGQSPIQTRQGTAQRNPLEYEAILMGACIQAATALVIAKHLHTGGELEKQIAERAYNMYAATLSRFGLSGPR